jgi:hypothetical protein
MPQRKVDMDEATDLEDDERDALHHELEASIAEACSGELIDAEDVLAELRAMR